MPVLPYLILPITFLVIFILHQLKDNTLKYITLCGSTRFKDEFILANEYLTLKGYSVYSVAIFGHSDNREFTEEDKVLLDKVHFDKIKNSQAILVIDKDGYIGESTKKEINYAKKLNKKVLYLSKLEELSEYICTK